MHLFPLVNDIVPAIPSEASIFVKLDAVNGYFQIALDEESSKLTTFILPSEHYGYLRFPQGLKWCRKSDVAIEGLPWARKLVNDIIISASNICELSLRTNEITSHCEKLNIILSKKKFVIREEISFTGYVICKSRNVCHSEICCIGSIYSAVTLPRAQRTQRKPLHFSRLQKAHKK